jgi:DDE superfamily endonuclease
MAELARRVGERIGDVLRPGGRPAAAGIPAPVAMVVALWRENLTQQVAGAFFGVSQSTVSRRWDLLREPISLALADVVPAPAEIAGTSTVLVDGTLVPTWDWRRHDDLYNKKHEDHGMNLHVAALHGHRLVAVGEPVPGARHDACAYHASGLARRLEDLDVLGDLGCVGVDDITTGAKKPAGGELTDNQKEANRQINGFRSHNEHVIGHLKNWKMLSHRYRAPLEKLAAAVRAIVALHFFRYAYEPH